MSSTSCSPRTDGRKRELHFPWIFLLSDSQFPRKWIEETLQKGYTIICDRYYYSGMVYSAAKRSPTLSLEWAKAPDVGLPRPDAVVFLDLEPEEAEKRGGYGDEKYEKKEMQQRVRGLFLDLLNVKGDEAGMKVVNAGESVEIVGGRILEKIEQTLKSAAEGSVEVGKVYAW
jgi:dTMP kinase